MPFKRTALDDKWRFKQATSLNNATATDFHDVAQFPTVAHIDLLFHGLIKDPYVDMNELESLWVNDADWTYQTIFDAPNLVAENTPHAGGQTPVFNPLHLYPDYLQDFSSKD